jgi:sulfur carrier protein
MQLTVTVNDTAELVDPGTTVDGLIRARAAGHRHVAVALNGSVVPRSAWPSTRLADGDRVEVLAAVAGG